MTKFGYKTENYFVEMRRLGQRVGNLQMALHSVDWRQGSVSTSHVSRKDEKLRRNTQEAALGKQQYCKNFQSGVGNQSKYWLDNVSAQGGSVVDDKIAEQVLGVVWVKLKWVKLNNKGPDY